MIQLSNLLPCKLSVVLYHIVSDAHLPHSNYLYKNRQVSRFIKDMDFLASNFRVITLDSAINHLNGIEKIPENSILITFDDGFSEMYNIVMPILLEKGLPATFFLISESLDNKSLPFRNRASLIADFIMEHQNKMNFRVLTKLLKLSHHSEVDPIVRKILAVTYNNKGLLDELAHLLDLNYHQYLQNNLPFLTSSQIKEMIDKGFSIGAHSIDHPNFNYLTRKEMLEQVSQSLYDLEHKNVLTHRAFAFPFHSNMIDNEFLVTLYDQYKVDITFGTNGLVKDRKFHHFQRFHMDFAYGSMNFHLIKYFLKGILKGKIG